MLATTLIWKEGTRAIQIKSVNDHAVVATVIHVNAQVPAGRNS